MTSPCKCVKKPEAHNRHEQIKILSRPGEVPADTQGLLIKGINEETLDAQGVLSLYCSILYEHHGTYEEVARISNLDRRTVKKHIQSAKEKFGD